MASSDVIAQIKERTSIAELVGEHVALGRAGRNLRGLCPFHPEKTPSFYVFPDQGSYHCFGCGAHGDAFAFTMRTQRADFGSALRDLAQRTGVALPERRASGSEERRTERLRQILEMAAQLFHHVLREAREGEAARAYLAQRGIERPTQEAFQLGYAPASGDALWTRLRGQGVEQSEALEAGLLIEREDGRLADRFRQRVIFPIRDASERLSGFGGRALGDAVPKYLNSPQSALFDKGATLYALDRARSAIRESGTVVVVEGYVDAVVAHQAGFRNAVASMGTALTERQGRQLSGLAGRIVLALDADAAGDQATQRGIEVLVRGLQRRQVHRAVGPYLLRPQQVVDAELRIARLPAGQDPDEIILRDPRAWEALCAQAVAPVDYYLALARERFDLRTPVGQRSAIALLAPILDSYDSLDRQHYLQRLAHLLGVGEGLILQQLTRLGARTPRARRTQYDVLGELAASSRGGPPAIERYAIALLLREPRSATICASEMDPSLLADPRAQALLSHLLAHRDDAGAVDLARAREALDDALAQTLDEIVAHTADWLPINPPLLPQEVGSVWRQLRLHRLDREYAQAHAALAGAQGATDGEATRTLHLRIAQLNAQVETLKRAGAQRGATWLEAVSLARAVGAATASP